MRIRWGNVGRLAAIPASYALASLIAAAIVRAAPTTPVDAVSIGFLSFFPVWTALILWAFGTHRPARMWLMWTATTVILAGAVTASIALGGRA